MKEVERSHSGRAQGALLRQGICGCRVKWSQLGLHRALPALPL